MHIIEVAPIAKGLPEESLSYFYAEHVEPGTLVKVPLRKKTVYGIAISSASAESMKSQIRGAEFELKKITSTTGSRFFSAEFIEAARETALYFATRAGSVIHSFAHPDILEEVARLPNTHENRVRALPYEKNVIQTDDEERFAHYKSLIRETFARRGSVFFCLPTAQDIERSVATLTKGIEEYTCIIHSGLTKKQQIEVYAKILTANHPILIIGTGSYLSVPRKDIGMVILEKENARSYKTQSRPYLDYRVFAEYLTKHTGARLVVGDLFLQTETMFRLKNGDFVELYPIKFRSLTTSRASIVDMRAYKATEKQFTVISDELVELVRKNKESNEHLFIYTARKGLSPTTVCGDCGTIVSCKTCGSPTVLHGSVKGNFFLCHKCGERRDADEYCVTCSGWRLVTLGIGSERVLKELQEKVPESRIFLFDKETAPSKKEAMLIINKFYATPGSILLGTEMALNYLDTGSAHPIQNSAIASIDALFSVPDFKISEKVLGIILKIRSLTQSVMLLQTRNPEHPTLAYAMAGNIVDFYREEISMRKMFAYPPFSILIKLSIEGQREKIIGEMSRAKQMLEAYEVDIFPSFVKGRRGQSVLNALIKIPTQEWPDLALVEILRFLPPQFTVKVDPESLL